MRDEQAIDNAHKAIHGGFILVVSHSSVTQCTASKKKRKILKLWLKLTNIIWFCIKTFYRHFKRRVTTLKRDDSDFP